MHSTLYCMINNKQLDSHKHDREIPWNRSIGHYHNHINLCLICTKVLNNEGIAIRAIMVFVPEQSLPCLLPYPPRGSPSEGHSCLERYKLIGKRIKECIVRHYHECAIRSTKSYIAEAALNFVCVPWSFVHSPSHFCQNLIGGLKSRIE